MEKPLNDLHVIATSDALAGSRIDVVISGSIAAVESVKFIRALRRLGAEVTPWITSGGANFITPLAVTWAAGKDAVTGFSGNASHIASSDAVIVAPASSSILAKIARGMTDSHSTALVASALGQNKPVLILPSMHDSLLAAPAMGEHLAKISSWKNVSMLSSRQEEGKQKFPDPVQLADQIAHILNRPSRPKSKVLVTMGTTRGYIDDVRYISNYSSGALGSLISEELFRQGFSTYVVAGPCEHTPSSATILKSVLTTGDMLAACTEAQSAGLAGGVFCASVLDYEPGERSMGKIKSGRSNLTVSFKPTPKIIDLISLQGLPKIGFKLEIGLSYSQAESLAKDYIQKYKLSMLIANELTAVSATAHHAWAFSKTESSVELNSKAEIARHIAKSLSQAVPPS
jgi:phosphopantothenoylcysteine decarboxylase / phosphopantothenate---cysteine ligase